MDFSFDTIVNLATLFLGGGGGAFFTWRYLRQQEKAKAKEAEANAVSAETSAVKEVQDVYQQLIADMKADRNEQKVYIQELKDDRRNLREDRDGLRERQDKMEEQIRDLQKDVDRNGRQLECLRPLLCGRRDCQDRLTVTITRDGSSAMASPGTEEEKKEKKKK